MKLFGIARACGHDAVNRASKRPVSMNGLQGAFALASQSTPMAT
jgi:hypothetical protein